MRKATVSLLATLCTLVATATEYHCEIWITPATGGTVGVSYCVNSYNHGTGYAGNPYQVCSQDVVQFSADTCVGEDMDDGPSFLVQTYIHDTVTPLNPPVQQKYQETRKFVRANATTSLYKCGGSCSTPNCPLPAWIVYGVNPCDYCPPTSETNYMVGTFSDWVKNAAANGYVTLYTVANRGSLEVTSEDLITGNFMLQDGDYSAIIGNSQSWTPPYQEPLVAGNKQVYCFDPVAAVLPNLWRDIEDFYCEWKIEPNINYYPISWVPTVIPEISWEQEFATPLDVNDGPESAMAAARLAGDELAYKLAAVDSARSLSQKGKNTLKAFYIRIYSKDK